MVLPSFVIKYHHVIYLQFLLDGAIVLLCPATFSEVSLSYTTHIETETFFFLLPLQSVSEVRLRMDGFQSHFQNTTVSL